MTGIMQVLSERDATKSELCRIAFLDPRLRILAEQPQYTIAAFLRVSEGLVSKCRRQAELDAEAGIDRERGRPSLLSQPAEEAIRDWIRAKTAVRDWPILRDVKEQIVAELEKIDPNIVPSQSYYAKVIKRLLTDEFTIKNAQPLEEARCTISEEIIQLHFEKLREIAIGEIAPQLILNIDETGFGASKSGRAKSRKVIVPLEFRATPVFRDSADSHFVTALCAISAAGDVLPPALITKRGTEHPDAGECSYIPNTRRHTSPKAFVTREIYADYLRTVISPYIAKWRETLGQDARALILFDGHKAHLSEILNAWAAENQILLYTLPPHSSHLLQPLDQGFFRRLKIQYGLFPAIKHMSKISGILERIWMAIQATTVTRLVWNAWQHTGIVPGIEEGVCQRCTLSPEHVLADGALQAVMDGRTPTWEGGRGRGVSTGEFGLLNEDEMLIWEAGQCPFCCHPLRAGQ
jgi:hypothetical protein